MAWEQVDMGQAWLVVQAGYQSPLFRRVIMSPGQGLSAQTVREGSHGDRAWQCYVSSPPACVYSSGVSLEEGPSQRGQRF